MAGTRSISGANGDSNKRKAEDDSSPNNAKAQKTLDETFSNGQQDTSDQQVDGANEKNDDKKPLDSFKGQNKEGESKDDPEKALKDSRAGNGLNTVDGKTNEKKDVPQDDVHANQRNEPELKAEAEQKDGTENKDDSESKKEHQDTSNGDAIEEEKEREEALPSNILEKGVIYFFTRGRVGIEDMESVTDVQRSYFVLRPLPDGAKIGDGAMDDLKTNRLIALPKKVWPKSGKDRFMAFVEKAKVSNKELKDEFFQGSEYSTKTTGVRQTPPVTPIGEGVYAITSTGNRGETHLAYMLTVPQEPGNMQTDMGIDSKGSFILSLKNPEVKGPANASLPQKPDYPKEFIDEFRNRGWMPVEPKHLDYANAQMLLIGESLESGSALEATKKDENDDKKETPGEELEKLEHEDEIRIKHLKGDDTIFADLGISKKDYPDVATTW
ncbi:hypothetical protein B9Z65_6335 [Elsinoe australis]|uniref:Uncharacterized protein n=1 Tax=Elsinoe australis TaxID=40998 RepID=A0A2P8A8C6_9PEZI|nr:hypothetical protein B9Z65_6335 [Elsinoe australis]